MHAGDGERYRDGNDAAPFPDHLLIPQPAAGAVAKLAIDSRWDVRILAAVSKLTTSAVVANRFPTLRVKDPEGNTWYGVVASPAVAAGAANVEVWFDAETLHGGPDGTALVAGGTPSMWIPGGWAVELGAVNLDVGDQIGDTRLYVEKRLT